VEGDRILQVGPARSFKRPKNAAVLRAGDLTILPGLIDAHVHLGISGVIGYTFMRPQSHARSLFERNLLSELLGGVTQVRDLHMPVAIGQSLIQRVRQDPSLGARLIYSGPILSAPGGYGSPYSVPVANPQEARDRVDELVKEGAGIVKIAVTSRQLGNVGLVAMDAESAKAVVAEAHRQGLRVAAHVAGATAADLRVAVEAGVDSMEHMPGSFDPLGMPDTTYTTSGLLPEILARDITIVPTLSVEAGDDYGPTLGYLTDDPSLLIRLTPAQQRTLADNLQDFSTNPRRQAIAAAGRKRMQVFQAEVKRLYDAGVRLGAGTDAGNGLTFHGNLHTEIELLHESGIPPLEAIRMATSGNARLLGIEDRAGTVEPGKRADLLLVRGDPLEDLRVLRRVDRVVVAGRVVEVAGQVKAAVKEAGKRK
jgi:imidazolonepropionase-like amidohydrolase